MTKREQEKVNAEAEIAELELAKVRGELVIAEDVVKAWDDVLSALKGKLLSIPTKVPSGVCEPRRGHVRRF